MPTSRYQAVRAVHTRATTNEWVRLRPLRTGPAIAVVSPLLFAAGFPRGGWRWWPRCRWCCFLHSC